MDAFLKDNIGLIDVNNAVQLATRMDCRGFEPFDKRVNNTNQQGGSGNVLVTLGIPGGSDVSLLDYSKYGLTAKIRIDAAPVKTLTAYHTKWLNAALDTVYTVKFRGSNIVAPVVGQPGSIVYYLQVIDAGMLNHYSALVLYDNVTGLWELQAIVAHNGISIYTNVTNISMLDLGNSYNRKVTLHIAISNTMIACNQGPNVEFFVNGVMIDSCTINSTELNTNIMYGRAYVRSGGGMGIAGHEQYETIENMGALPLVLYGNGTTLDYEIAYATSGTYGANVFPDNGIIGGRNYINLSNSRHKMTFLLKKRNNACRYPMLVSLPITGILPVYYSLDFEHISPSQFWGSDFTSNTPLLMIDNSLIIDDNYKNRGSVIDIDDNETGLSIGSSIPTLLGSVDHAGACQLPSTKLEINYDIASRNVGNAGGSLDKIINPEGDIAVMPTSRNKQEANGQKSEASYSGVVVQHSELGAGDWPICSNRCPTDPITFYADSDVHNNAMVKLQDCGYKMFRFASINNPVSGSNDLALFAAWRDSSAAAGSTWTNMELVLGKYKLNDRIDVSAPNFVNGYRVLGIHSIVQMKDCPTNIGTDWNQYPDIAIVPVGDPSTTTTFRVYFVKSTGVGLVYKYELYYYTITNNGDNVSGPKAVVLKEFIDDPNTGNVMNSVFQFDVVQVSNGRFIFAITMGNDTWSNGAITDRDLCCVIYQSVDGTDLYDPKLFRTNKLRNGAVIEYFSFAFPSLSYRDFGYGNGELLLGLTAISSIDYAAGAGRAMQSGIFSLNIASNDWNSSINRSWSLLINCNKLCVESNYDEDATKTLSCSAFRDDFGKIHVCVIKMAWAKNINYFSGAYYAVFDKRNNSFAIRGGSTGSSNVSFGELDLVSFSRLYQNNRLLTSNNPVYNYDTAMLIRPKFSPIKNDCLFTINMQSLDALTIPTDMGRDVVFRLFQPTNLGELYPPSASWHHALGRPSSAILTYDPTQIWRKSISAGAAPALASDGLTWAGAGVVNNTYYVHTVLANDAYSMKLFKDSVAIKTRFKFTGWGDDPSLIINNTCMSIVVRFAWGFDANNNQVMFTNNLFFGFNSNSFQMRDIPGATDKLLIDGDLDLTVAHDLFIIGRHDPSDNKSYWNIYLESSPQTQTNYDDNERWKPKTWHLLNSEPISVDDSIAAFGAFPDDVFSFGGSPTSGAVGTWINDTLKIEYYHVYSQFYKEPGNIINTNLYKYGGIGAQITEKDACYVGGPTRELAFRKKYFDLTQRDLCPGSFQVRDTTDNNNSVEISARVGNGMRFEGSRTQDTIMDIHNDRLVSTNEFITGVRGIFDNNPQTVWRCQNLSTPRIVFDAMSLPSALDKIIADSVWLINCNLISIKLMGDDAANWGAPAFSLDIDFISDRGNVVSFGGTPGSDDLMWIEDITKDWIPNQFVNKTYPFYITSVDFNISGGMIVKNTATRIYYKLSTDVSGSLYTQIGNPALYYILSPHKVASFTQCAYRYWALDLAPAAPLWYCESTAKIGEFGLGLKMALDFSDSGMSESFTEAAITTQVDDGGFFNNARPYYNNRDFSLTYSNITAVMKNKIIDMFMATKYKEGIRIWFAPYGELVSEDIILCDIIDSKTEITTNIKDQSGDIDDGVYRVTLKLRERT